MAATAVMSMNARVDAVQKEVRFSFCFCCCSVPFFCEGCGAGGRPCAPADKKPVFGRSYGAVFLSLRRRASAHSCTQSSSEKARSLIMYAVVFGRYCRNGRQTGGTLKRCNTTQSFTVNGIRKGLLFRILIFPLQKTTSQSLFFPSHTFSSSISSSPSSPNHRSTAH